MGTFLRILGAFVVMVLAIVLGTVGGCFVGFTAGFALPATGPDGLGHSINLGVLGGIVGLVAGVFLAARMLGRPH